MRLPAAPLSAAVVALVTLAAADARAREACGPSDWLADPGITPQVLRANGYRVVASRTTTGDTDGQAVELFAVRKGRMAMCRTTYDGDADVVETVCFLPCDTR